MDHVPPKQFYLKEIRSEQALQLWKVPTHVRCNSDYREDEEYFFHAVYPLVRKGNPAMGELFHRDLMRRTNKPQTPAMVRRLLKDFRSVTEVGIHLPPGIVAFDLDKHRMQRVVIKLAQGLFYRDQERYLPQQNCKDIRLCELESEVPELYQLSWQGAERRSVLPEVFSYRRFEFDDLHLFTMLFWEAFIFCAAFEDPVAVSVPGA